jgi:RNA-binding protein Tab2/Atab2
MIIAACHSFSPSQHPKRTFISPLQLSTSPSSSSSSLTSPTKEYLILKPEAATDEWEIDCFSRPVIMEDGKKLWEVLITDSVGSFRFKQILPSNQVNSKTVRQVVDDLIEIAEVKPNVIRFFRGAMFNMIQIALSELPVTSKPSRCTFALASWLEELYANTYPKMNGYNPSMVSSSGSTPSFLDIRTPIKLPDALRGEKYAFVALPIQEFLPGGSVTTQNIGVGRLCPVPNAFLPSQDDGDDVATIGADTFVQGVVILSSRAAALAAWLAGTEVVALQADLRKRILTMETDIDNQYLMAKLNDQQRSEAVAFEEGKDVLQGLHFISVQKTEDDDPEGFWLLRELPSGI